MIVKESRSIKEWMDIFSELYSLSDENRTPEQMWIAVIAHTSSIGEAIRKFTFESLLKSAAHTFCWLCSFVNKCNRLPEADIFSFSESLCGIVTLKYPNRCGHCNSSPCSCDPVKIEKETDKSAMYTVLLDRRNRDLECFEGYSIKKFKEMFYEIYGGRSHIQTLESIGFHFLEEIGEASVNIRKLSQLRNVTADDSSGIDEDFFKQLLTVEQTVKYYNEYYDEYFKEKDLIKYTSTEPNMLKARIVDAKMGLLSEIGDSFSWFCSILNKLDSISRFIFNKPEEHTDILKSLEKVLNDEYIDSTGKAICPSCKRNPCKCVFYNIGSGNIGY